MTTVLVLVGVVFLLVGVRTGRIAAVLSAAAGSSKIVGGS